MVFESHQSEVIEKNRDDDRRGDGDAGEDSCSHLLRKRETGDGRSQANEAAQPRPPGNVDKSAMVRKRLAEDELQKKKAHQSAPVNHDCRWQSVTELLIQLRTSSRLGGIKGTRGDGDEDE